MFWVYFYCYYSVGLLSLFPPRRFDPPAPMGRPRRYLTDLVRLASAKFDGIVRLFWFWYTLVIWLLGLFKCFSLYLPTIGDVASVLLFTVLIAGPPVVVWRVDSTTLPRWLWFVSSVELMEMLLGCYWTDACWFWLTKTYMLLWFY